MEFQSYKSEMPLFMIKDYWTKISTECYLILAVFLVIFFCRGSAWSIFRSRYFFGGNFIY